MPYPSHLIAARLAPLPSPLVPRPSRLRGSGALFDLPTFNVQRSVPRFFGGAAAAPFVPVFARFPLADAFVFIGSPATAPLASVFTRFPAAAAPLASVLTRFLAGVAFASVAVGSSACGFDASLASGV